MSDTPIFDQLAAERGYNRLIAGGPTTRFVEPRRFIGVSTEKNGYTPVGMILDEATGAQTDETVNAAPTEADEELIVYRKPIPVTTLAELAEGTHQE